MIWWRDTRKPSVHEQRARALRARKQLERQMANRGRKPLPVVIEGRAIARTFWGKAWCENLESYRDHEYRLPRGRSYVRNGAVLDLEIVPGSIRAVVSGSGLEPYEVEVKIDPLAAAHWARIKAGCAGHIASLIELLEGRLSDRVMNKVTDREQGLFPKPGELRMSCTCPDRATMCKHVAAALYGVGARLDTQPELLFTLRTLDHGELIAQAPVLEVSRTTRRKTIAEEDLERIFGIDLAETPGKTAAPRKGRTGRLNAPMVRAPGKTPAGGGKGRSRKSHRAGRTAGR